MRAVLPLALLAACGVDTIAIEDYDLALARADCEQETRCGTFDTVEHCLAFERLHFPITPSIEAAVTAGLVTYDPVQAAQCVAEHEERSCALVDRTWRLTPSSVCVGVLRSGRLLGAPCAIDDECDSRHCSAQMLTHDCGMGTCVEAAHAAGPGEDCTQVGCAPNGWCAPGINVCVPLLPQGAQCVAASQCGYGLDCFDTCQPPPAVGDPCPTLEGQPTCGFTAGLTCDPATNACAAPLQEGDPCDPDADRCASGYLSCVRDRRVCAQFPAVGEPCVAPSYHCAAGAVCAFTGEGAAALCVPLVDDGSPCDGQDDLCASGQCNYATEVCEERTVCT
jgi:hypothetical protein